MLRAERDPSIKFGLGFEPAKISSATKHKLPNFESQFDSQKKQEESINESRNNQEASNDGFIKVDKRVRRIPRWTTRKDYQQNRFFNSYPNYGNQFYGQCYMCNYFGHQRSFSKMNTQPMNFVHKKSFTPLIDFTMECYNYHNYGHIANFCRNELVNPSKRNDKVSKITEPIVKLNSTIVKIVWRRKDNSAVQPLIYQVTFKAQNKPKYLIIDSGCIKHMIGYKERFQNLQKYEGGSVKFRNNDGAKIVGKGTVKWEKEI